MNLWENSIKTPTLIYECMFKIYFNVFICDSVNYKFNFQIMLAYFLVNVLFFEIEHVYSVSCILG